MQTYFITALINNLYYYFVSLTYINTLCTRIKYYMLLSVSMYLVRVQKNSAWFYKEVGNVPIALHFGCIQSNIAGHSSQVV
jgi:hypothetical protein